MALATRPVGATLACLLCGHETEWDRTIVPPRRQRCRRCGGDLMIEEIRRTRVRKTEDDERRRW